ncbi:MAG TPA: ABC transporter substrate-binding protein [Candidatus Methanoperedenaceae archaeon]|nr:ABC transporter substrate-binding protein [Candidatus Methanoperedenaceae archaeon]
MNNKPKIFLAIIIIAIVASTYLFLAMETKTQEAPTPALKNTENTPKNGITIRSLTIPGSVEPVDFAKELGFLKGLNITRAGSTTGGPEKIMAVSAGNIELGSSAWIPVINAKSRGAEIKAIVASGGNNTKWIVLENSSIRSAKDLVGKKIAVNVLGGSVEYITRAHLVQNGISKDAVQLVVLPPPQHEQALRQGLVDVAAPFDPVGEKIVANGGVRVLFTDTDATGDVSQGLYFVSEKFLKENPEAVKRLVEGITKAMDWDLDHPQEAKELVAKILKDRGENPDLAKYWKGFGEIKHGIVMDSDVEFWIEWLEKDGKIKEGQLEPSDVYSNEFNPYYKEMR